MTFRRRHPAFADPAHLSRRRVIAIWYARSNLVGGVIDTHGDQICSFTLLALIDCFHRRKAGGGSVLPRHHAGCLAGEQRGRNLRALWRGVPVVSCRGDRRAGVLGATVLRPRGGGMDRPDRGRVRRLSVRCNRSRQARPASEVVARRIQEKPHVRRQEIRFSFEVLLADLTNDRAPRPGKGGRIDLRK